MQLLFKTAEVIDHEATGAAARQSRKQSHKSLRDVANKMGVSHAFVADLERGRRNWSAENVERFSEALK